MQVAALGDGVSLEARLLSRFVPCMTTHASQIFISLSGHIITSISMLAGRKQRLNKGRLVFLSSAYRVLEYWCSGRLHCLFSQYLDSNDFTVGFQMYFIHYLMFPECAI